MENYHSYYIILEPIFLKNKSKNYSKNRNASKNTLNVILKI